MASAPPGVVIAWGNDGAGQTSVPAGLSNVVAEGGGASHSLALRGDGSVIAWGSNAYGQTNVPSSLTNATMIAAGGTFSLALKADHSIAAWGQYFNGTAYAALSVPGGLANVTAIAGGGAHVVALKGDGMVTAWGYNGYGQTNVPAGLSNVVAVAAGADHSLALRSDGTVVSWGQIYTGAGYISAASPAGLTNITAIAAGDYHSLALRADGTVTAWGYDEDGETNVPSGLSNVVAIAGGGFHNLALNSNGTVTAWGDNGDGQTTVPTGLSTVAAIAGGGTHSLAITLVPVLGPGLPASVALEPGEGTNLSVTVLAGSPFECQWFFDGLPLAGSNGTSLVLANFDLSHAGVYSVVVSNQFAAATASSVVRLTNSPVVLVDGVDAGGGTVTRTNSSVVAMSSSYGPSANLYYTLDGSDPDFTGLPYPGEFTLTKSATVRAIAYNAAYTAEAEAAPISVHIWQAYALTATTAGGGAITVSPAASLGGSLYLSNTVVKLTAMASNGWSFLNWTGDITGSSNVMSVVVDGPLAAQAVFGTKVSVVTNGDGQVWLDPPTGPFPYGSTVEARAVPAAGSYFFGWAGGAGGFDNPLTLMMTNPISLTALFGLIQTNQVMLIVSANGGGTVAVDPLSNIYAVGETVTLTALPASDSNFASWSGSVSATTNPLVLTLTSNLAVAANFVLGTATNPGGTSPFPILVSFDATNGSNPNAVAFGVDGNLYGTTQSGGSGTNGTVFRVTPEGQLTTLHFFSDSEGHNPQAGVTLRKYDGNLYGTTASGSGTVFRVTTNGTLTTLVSFAATNGSEPNSLMEAADGNFYGTTQAGGTNGGSGTVFEVTFNGRLTPLFSFGAGADGAYPLAGLIQGADGSFYGTTTQGGANNAGTVFKLSAAGVLTTVYSFTGGDDGYFPAGALTQAADGSLYGTTQFGGTNDVENEGDGTIFRIGTNGGFTTLASFNGLNGAYPQAALVQDADGSFWGTTTQGGASFGSPASAGAYGFGTVFRVTSAGTLTTFVSFGGTNGAYPQTALVRGNDGSFYGTTVLGGSYDCGTVFKFAPPAVFAPAAPVIQGTARDGANLLFTWLVATGQTCQVQCKTNLSQAAWDNLGASALVTNPTLTVVAPLSPVSGPRFYRLALLAPGQ